jgi:hypothetical protein
MNARRTGPPLCSAFTTCLMQESNGAEVAPEFLRDLTVVRAAA